MAKKEFSLESLDQQNHKPKDTGIPQRGNEKAKVKPTEKTATPATPSKLRTKLGDERRSDSLNLKVKPTLRDAFSKQANKANMTKADFFEAMVLDWIENNK